MFSYRILLRIGGELTDMSTDVVCDSDREARELAQRILEDGSSRGRRVEVWADRRFVAAIIAARVLKWKAAGRPAHEMGAT